MTFGKKITPTLRLVALGIVCVWTSGTIGCDTVAQISFQDRSFNRIEGIGMSPVAGECGGSSGEAELRFVMIASDSTPIRPNEVISNERVDLSRDSVSISQTRLYELPDVECSDGSCVFEGDNFSCSLGLEGGDAALRRCNRELSMSATDIEFVADNEKPQIFAMIVENSGSLGGWLPSDVASYWVDWDGDGFAEGAPDTNLLGGRATDRSNNRKVAFSQVANSWRNAARLALNENRPTLFGMWQFSGTSTADVRSLVIDTPANSVWAEQEVSALAAVNNLEDAGQRRANVYQALSTVLEGPMAEAEYANHEKTVLVFVDGPDDLRLNAFDEQRVITAARAVNAQLFFVHLDPAQTLLGLDQFPLFRDDPRYWEDQSPCADDTACENFEECRRPTAFATTPNAPVEIGVTSDTYCLPKRDDNGRIGPIHAYQRIACETDGSYVYVPSAGSLSRRMQYLPYAMDGLWKVTATLDAFENQRVAPDEGYKVQAVMSVNVGRLERPLDFSQAGDNDPGASQFADGDTRGVLFHKR